MAGVWSEMGAYKRTSLLHFTHIPQTSFTHSHSFWQILNLVLQWPSRRRNKYLPWSKSCGNWSRVSWTVMITQFTLRTRLFMLFLPSMIWSAPLLAQPTWIMHPFLHTFDALSLVTWWQILLSWPLDRFSFFRHQDSIFFSLSRIKNLFHILERKGETYKYTRYHLIKRKVLKKGWEFKSEH